MKKDLLKEDLVGKYFNRDTYQVAYSKSFMMSPNDHGYIKYMKAYHDLENDMCICRNYDNPNLLNKGFRIIMKDEDCHIKNYKSSFNPDYHIKLSEVKKILNISQRPDKLAKISGKIYIKDTKGKKDKIVVDLQKQKEKQTLLMKEITHNIKLLRVEKNEEQIIELTYNIGDLLRKNLFTKEDLKKFITNETFK